MGPVEPLEPLHVMTPSRTSSPVTMSPAASWVSGTMPVGSDHQPVRELRLYGVTVDESRRRLDRQSTATRLRATRSERGRRSVDLTEIVTIDRQDA